MSTSKHIDFICIAAVAVMLVITILLMSADRLGIVQSSRMMGYEKTLFDTSYVHHIDIVMDDWDSFIQQCEKEEYAACTVVVDGDQFDHIAIRAKGNTSLSRVKSLDSQRYSWKLEFDHYEDGKSYKGLDKLCLNNLIQDNTMMKDYIVYQMMCDFGVDSPLCSFAYLTVNGEDWGLYLAVEGIEESFLARNYGADAGELYKPDSMSVGGDRSSDGVKLQYIDDDPDSCSNIFDHAVTDVSEADEKRLIASLKNLSSYTALESTLDTDEILRYFVVHNFVCNGDSYTGEMIHNYYLHEKNGKLAMIPWDYNLAFGAFEGNRTSSVVNQSIDDPISDESPDDRPMLGWIFSDERYIAQYHALFSDWLEEWFSDGVPYIADTAAMIRPYVERDPTKFCTTEDFDTAVAALTQFVTLRADAVRHQLAGEEGAVAVDSLRLSDMGSMGNTAKASEIPEKPSGQERKEPPEKPSGEAKNSGFSGNRPPEDSENVEGRAPEAAAPSHDGDSPAEKGDISHRELLLGVSVLVLLAGLLFVGKYKR